MTMNPTIQKRESSLELLRIIAMLLVLMVHAGFKALGIPTVEEVASSPASSFLRFLSESVAIVCVNVFILITGWFGIRPKVSRFCGLVFQVVFIGAFIYLCLLLLGKTEPWGVNGWVRLLLFRRGLWFVSAYMVLYVLAPVLNAFVTTAHQQTFRNVLLAFFAVQTLCGFCADYSFFGYGYTPLSFIGLYLLARYMSIYRSRFCTLNKWYDMTIYACSTLLTAVLSMVVIRYTHRDDCLYDYLSPIVIVSSVYFFLFFTKLSFHSKAVNWVASSAFAVYLFHCDPLFFDSYYLLPIKEFYVNDTLPLFVLHTASLMMAVFVLAIVVDKLRIAAFNVINRCFR